MPRRSEALSREKIVMTSLEILDSEGEGALTFRGLAARLHTGAGAIYWHVADKDELLQAVAEEVVGRFICPVTTLEVQAQEAQDDPGVRLRVLAASFYDAIDRHPWLGTQLARMPWQSAVTQLFEAIGQQVAAFDVAPGQQFDAASAVLSYLLGLASQHAAAARLQPGSRSALLTDTAQRWQELDPLRYPFTRRVAAQLAGHDDRQQFLAGIDLLLAGITALKSSNCCPGVTRSGHQMTE